MAALTLEIDSDVMGARVPFRIVFNEQLNGPFPVLYLLHGLGGNCRDWTCNCPLEKLIRTEQRPLMIVMPEGGRGWFCDSPLGAYETFITTELRSFVERTFPVHADRDNRWLAGNSMGGYGALKMAFKFPELYAAAAGLEPAVDVARRKPGTAAWRDNFDVLHGHMEDPADLARSCDPLPRIYFDCGLEDAHLASCDRFHNELAVIPHEYRRFPGGHNWIYWNEHIGDALNWLLSDK